MSKVVLVFDGGSRGNPGAGYGSYAIVKGSQHTITRLEFGAGMTSPEAEYDTLITALKMLHRQEPVGTTMIEVRTSSQLIVNQVKGTWQARDARMQSRRDQVRGLLSQFKSFSIIRVLPEQVAASLNLPR
jgi:ribonuclease HI